MTRIWTISQFCQSLTDAKIRKNEGEEILIINIKKKQIISRVKVLPIGVKEVIINEQITIKGGEQK